MKTKSKKDIVQETANNSGSSGKRKKEKKRKSKKEKQKDDSRIRSFRKSIRSQFQKMKGNGSKKHFDNATNSSVASSVTSDLDELILNNPPKSPTKDSARLPPSALEKKNSKFSVTVGSIDKKAPAPVQNSTPEKSRDSTPKKKRESTSKKNRDIPKPKKKEEFPESKKRPTEKALKKQKEKGKSQRRSKSIEADPVLSYPDDERGNVRKKRSDKKKHRRERNSERRSDDRRERRSDDRREHRREHRRRYRRGHRHGHRHERRREYRTYSDSSDYSDSDSGSSYGSDESSAYSDPGFAYNESVSSSESDTSGSSSDSSGSYSSSDESEGITMRTERCADRRNPEASSGRSRKSRRKADKASGHIRSPRSSARKSSSHHIRSPRRSTYYRDEDDLSDEMSYVSGSSYGSSGSDSSGSSYSESETNDEYYTTSYDDDRNLRDSTFSGSWTERQPSSYVSEETELRNRKSRAHYPSLMEEPSTHTKGASRSTMGDSRCLDSVDEREYDEFVKQEEAAEQAQQKIGAALAEKQEELEGIQKLKERQSNAGVFSWFFGGPEADTQSTPESENINEDEKGSEAEEDEEDSEAEEETKSTEDHLSQPKSPVQKRKERETPPLSPHSSRSQRSTIRSPRSPKSPASSKSLRSPKSPKSPKSPRSPTASKDDFIVRDRRSAIFHDGIMDDQSQDADPTLSPGCSVGLKEILDGGDSMPGSYGGLQDGEYLLSSPSEKGDASTEKQSVTMKGSGTFEKQEDDSSSNSSGDDTPDEIAFLPEAPVVSSPTRSRRFIDSLLIPEDKDMDPSFLICCCSPENSPKAGDLPSSGNVEKEFNRMVANSKYRNDDDSTCASTIHTEGFKDLKDNRTRKTEEAPLSGEEAEDGKDVQYYMVPVENEAQNKKADEDSSCAEKIEMELGPYTSASTSYDDTNIEQEDQESAKRIKAEDLDNYEISEIVHGRRAYKSKTDEDGLPIPVSNPSETTVRRERRKKALEAHREYIYKSHSIDTNPSKDGADNTGRRSRSTAFSDSTQAINDEKSSPREGGPSDLSNSIVQEGVSAPTDSDQPDGLLSLVQNAFNGLISPKNEADTPDSGAKSDRKAPASGPEDGGDSQTPKAGPVDDMLEAAFRFFAPKEEAEKGQESTERSDEIEGKVSSTEYTEASDEAVLKNSKSYASSDKAGDAMEGNFFNADGIPLELRPNKIWRVFDSGYNVAASVLTGPTAVAGESDDTERGDSKPNENQETEGTLEAAKGQQKQVQVDPPLDSILSIRTEGYYLKSDGSSHADVDEQPAKKNPASPKLNIQTETKELEASVQRLANSARYQRRNEMKRMRARRSQQESSTKPVDPDGDKAAEEILAVSPPQSPVSPTIRGWFGISGYEQNGTPPTRSEEEVRVPPSPVASIPPVSPVSPSQYNNISDIRSRIKQRQRRRQQQEHQEHQSDTTATTVSKPAVVVSKVKTKTTPKAVSRYLQATADRRDDSFPDDATDEFYDAQQQLQQQQQQSKYTMSPVLSNKSSMLSGAMSLD